MVFNQTYHYTFSLFYILRWFTDGASLVVLVQNSSQVTSMCRLAARRTTICASNNQRYVR